MSERYAILIGDRDTLEVFEVLGPVTDPVRHEEGEVSWSNGSVRTQHGVVIVPFAGAPKVGDTWIPTPEDENDITHIDLDRARKIITDLLQSMKTARSELDLARDYIVDLRQRVAAIEQHLTRTKA